MFCCRRTRNLLLWIGALKITVQLFVKHIGWSKHSENWSIQYLKYILTSDKYQSNKKNNLNLQQFKNHPCILPNHFYMFTEHVALKKLRPKLTSSSKHEDGYVELIRWVKCRTTFMLTKRTGIRPVVNLLNCRNRDGILSLIAIGTVCIMAI